MVPSISRVSERDSELRMELDALLAEASFRSCPSSNEQLGTARNLSPRLELEALAQGAAFNGVILVSRKGSVLYQAARGFADWEARTPLRLDHQFAIGSISKQMTAAIVLRAADEGRLRLGDPLDATVPFLADDWAGKVTIEQLLNHTSGIEAVGRPLVAHPGSAFAYINADYELLGRVVEHANGTSFEAEARKVFDLCGMRDTVAPPSSSALVMLASLPQLVPGYSELEDGCVARDDSDHDASDNPAGGIVSTAADLVAWSRCLHRGALLRPDSYRAMVSPAALARRNHRWGTLGYGFGIQVSESDGVVEYSHSGYVPGYISTMTYYPAQDVTAVVLENLALRPDDLGRVFRVQDRVRDIVRRRAVPRRVDITRPKPAPDEGQ